MSDQEEPGADAGKGWIESLGKGNGLQDDGGFVLPLTHHVQVGEQGDPVVELRFRAPCGKDYRSAPANPKDLGPVMQFGQRLCGQPSVVIDKLKGHDVTRFIEVASGFFTGAPERIGIEPSGQ